MAPKMGGGGDISVPEGSGGIDMTASNHCVSSAISQPTVVARLVVDGLCLTFTIFLTWLWFRARKRTPSIKHLLPWYTFGLLLALTVVYLILGILISALGSCFVIGPLGAAELSVPASVASDIANILLLGIILLPLSRRLLLHAGYNRTIPTIVSATLVTLTAIAFVPSIVLSNMASIYRFSSGLDNSSKSLITSLSVKIAVAFYLIYFVAAIIGCSILGFALVGAVKNMTYQTEARIWIICMISTLLIGSGSAVLEMFGWALPARSLSEGAWIAFLTTFNIFFVTTVFAVLESAHSIAVPTVNPKDNATYDPDAPEEMQPALRQRFTYTGSAEIQIPPYARTPDKSSWPLGSPKWPLGSPSRATFGLGNGPPSPRVVVQHAF